LKREITIDGKPFQVEISECPIGSRFSIKVNKKMLEIMLEQEPNYAKGFSIKVNEKSYNVELPGIDINTPFSIRVNNIPFKIELKSAITPAKITLAAPSQVSAMIQKPTKVQGEGAITAPMAGKIISIRVKKGDLVKIGNVLCVLEAMKMENEITATRNGVVEEVSVQEGKAVNEGNVLMLIK